MIGNVVRGCSGILENSIFLEVKSNLKVQTMGHKKDTLVGVRLHYYAVNLS